MNSERSTLLYPFAFACWMIGLALLVGLLFCKLRRSSWFAEWLELPLYDLMVRAASGEQEGHPDVLVVGIEEAKGWPLSDGDLAETLQAIITGGATVVGLDLIRDHEISRTSGGGEPNPDTMALDEIGTDPRVIWLQSAAGGVFEFAAPPFILDLSEGDRGGHLAFPQLPVDLPNSVVRRGNISDGNLEDPALSLAAASVLRHAATLALTSPDPAMAAEDIPGALGKLGSLSPSAGGYWLFDKAGRRISGDEFLLKIGHNPVEAVATVTRSELIDHWRGSDEDWESFRENLDGKLVLIGTTNRLLAKDEIRVATDPELRGVKLHALAAAQLLRELRGEAPIRYLSDFAEDLIVILGALLTTLAFLVPSARLRWAIFPILPLATVAVGIVFLSGEGRLWLPMASVVAAETTTALAGVGFLWAIRSRERRLYFSALEKQLGKEVAKVVVGRLQELQSGTESSLEEFEGTVLFGDLSGFSKACQRYSSEGRMEEFFGWLNRFLKPAVELTGSCGGFVKQFTGDGIFVVFGFPPGSRYDHAERAVECATRIAEMVAELNKNLTGDFPPYYARFGVYTGPIFARAVGSEEHFDFSFWGTTVNKGSRLEGLDRHNFHPEKCPTRILVSDETRSQLADAGALKAYGEGLTTLKGFEEEPEQVWELEI